MRKEIIVNEFWSNILVSIILYISLIAAFVNCEKTGDYASWSLNGCIYISPCIVENIRFLLFETRQIGYPKWIITFVAILLFADVIYLMTDITGMLYGNNKDLVYPTLIFSALYPVRSFLFATYYFVTAFVVKEE